MSGSHLAKGVWVSALLGTLVTAQGCISNGDASLGNDGTTAGSGGAGASGQAGSTALGSGGKSNVGGASLGKSVVPSTGEGGATLVSGGETGEGGHSAVGACELPIESGPCEAAISRFAFDAVSGECKPFTYGGCEGNDNNFGSLAECRQACQSLVCPENLQSDTVFDVWPLNRPERACVTFDQPLVVSCSILLDPSLTVPTDYGENFCVKRHDKLYRAETTLPKADGWEDCTPSEALLVAQAPDCNDL